MSIIIEELNGWKFRLVKPLVRQTEIYNYDIDINYIRLEPTGLLTLKVGYAWDGATGTKNTDDIIEASAVHDALYQLMQLELLNRVYFDIANKLFVEMCREKGMKKGRLDQILWAVTRFGKSHTYPLKKPRNKIRIIE